MGMTRISDLVDYLSNSGDLKTREMCDKAHTLYLSILKGHISTAEIKPYITENLHLDQVPVAYQKEYAKLLELIEMIGSVQ